uniref:UDP-galactose transporter n=2 Tax=Panagrellus redivivus TaxID=6233 RepID=A0A7E4VAM4_PANRE
MTLDSFPSKINKFFGNYDAATVYKYLGIALLTLQQTSMPLMGRAARYREESEVFITTVNVFMMDVIKLVVCSTILIVSEGSIEKYVTALKSALFDDYVETVKIWVPAIIYILQNNLYYVALTNLEPSTFCVIHQLKIFTTAILLKVVLGKQLSSTQWVALVLLVVGVSNTQLQYEPPKQIEGYVEQDPVVGTIAVVTMCFTSAFAGVYMEKVLKQSTVNVWMQNVRLAIFGVVFSGVSMLYSDYETIKEDGFFRGFDGLVWILTTTNAVGGLTIAVVIKYADNILKAYAQSAAILGAAIGSWLLFDFEPNLAFLAGVIVVIVSIVLYTKYPYQAKSAPEKVAQKLIRVVRI